ncbi:ATP-binding cassette domain-containing protein [Campylobacter sp.]|uniref:ATP-binding cassette domain-containing protein n=1 Tax=Campylobacter sp. TaxID=205 RepID=UPI0026DBD64B|nr:ATP-binding cassette domain-containing protein [Campylobacter sp.]MDO4673560.1 ATP-binding cassette domain-containing protein [Campylobacter sp.]
MEVRNLSLSLGGKGLLENISFSLKSGQNLAIMGESGSGKSLLARALIGLFGTQYELSAKTLCVDGEDVLGMGAEDLRLFRAKFALVLQEASDSFYPYLNLGDMFHIVLKTHTKLNAAQRKQRAFECMRRLGFEDLELLWHSFAHQLSVGMARRLGLALALSSSPKYLVCDEITTSLDRENEKKIIHFLKEKKNLILITHDLNLAKELSDVILILERGGVAQFCKSGEFFSEDNAWLRAHGRVYA